VPKISTDCADTPTAAVTMHKPNSCFFTSTSF
jgi:hypothetical protein